MLLLSVLRVSNESASQNSIIDNQQEVSVLTIDSLSRLSNRSSVSSKSEIKTIAETSTSPTSKCAQLNK